MWCVLCYAVYSLDDCCYCRLPCVCIRIYFLSAAEAAAAATMWQRYYSCHFQNFWHRSTFSRKWLLFPHFISFLSSFVIIFHFSFVLPGVRTPVPFRSTANGNDKKQNQMLFYATRKKNQQQDSPFLRYILVMYTFDNNNSEKWDFMGVLEKRCLINDINIWAYSAKWHVFIVNTHTHASTHSGDLSFSSNKCIGKACFIQFNFRGKHVPSPSAEESKTGSTALYSKRKKNVSICHNQFDHKISHFLSSFICECFFISFGKTTAAQSKHAFRH